MKPRALAATSLAAALAFPAAAFSQTTAPSAPATFTSAVTQGAATGAFEGAVMGPLGAIAGGAYGAARAGYDYLTTPSPAAPPAAPAPASAPKPQASGGVCGVDYYGPCLPDPSSTPPAPSQGTQAGGGPGTSGGPGGSSSPGQGSTAKRPSPIKAASAPSAPAPAAGTDPFAPTPFDTLAFSSPDPLTREAARPLSQPLATVAHWEGSRVTGINQGGSSYAPGSVGREAAPILVASGQKGGYSAESAQPGPPPAQGSEGPYTSHIGAPVVVYVPGSDAGFDSTGRMPDAFSQLTVMGRRLPKAAQLTGDAESLALRMNHVWGLDKSAHKTPIPIRHGTEFFGIPLGR